MEKRYLILAHGGEGSGRYPEGSGKRPFQHVDFGKRQRIFNAAKSGLDFGKSGAGAMANIAKANAENANRNSARYLTDDQLKDLTNRQQLENNYVASLPESTVTSGWKKVGEILAITGSAVGIAATAAGLFKDLQAIKNGNGG